MSQQTESHGTDSIYFFQKGGVSNAKETWLCGVYDSAYTFWNFQAEILESLF